MAAQDNSDDDERNKRIGLLCSSDLASALFFSMCNRARVPIVPSKHMQLHPQTLQEGKQLSISATHSSIYGKIEQFSEQCVQLKRAQLQNHRTRYSDETPKRSSSSSSSSPTWLPGAVSVCKNAMHTLCVQNIIAATAAARLGLVLSNPALSFSRIFVLLRLARTVPILLFK